MLPVLTNELVRQAVDIVRPTIEATLGSDQVDGKPNLHLVVLDPGLDNIVLYEESFGNKDAWEWPYDKIARSKALICQRTGMVTRDMRTNAPWFYYFGDTQYVGGVVKNGLVVAASGLPDHFDEMLCWQVLSAIQALCRDFILKIPGNKDGFYET